jgi:uncharacterized protein (DUF2235 family)
VKRIVICADGTWNIRDQLDKKAGKRRPTNVTKLARAVRSKSSSGIDQVVCYHDGVGTNWGLDRFTGGAFGRGIENNIRELYRFILYNYNVGDELYLFGFSRGAFTVRTLAGFLNFVGLLEKDDDYYVPEAYRCYVTGAKRGSTAWSRAFHNVQGTGPAPPIRMIGVWDTVGALGAPGLLGRIFNRNKYKYHDISLTPQVENAFHAMAVDERRKPFAVDVWDRPAGWPGTVEQAWFAGVHSDVGGGYTPDGLANEALHWMAEKAERLGLELDSTYLSKFRPCFNSQLHNSMTWLYQAMGPVHRPIGGHVASGEAIHQSVLDRLAHAPSKYSPAQATVLRAGQLPPAQTARIARGTPC